MEDDWLEMVIIVLYIYLYVFLLLSNVSLV